MGTVFLFEVMKMFWNSWKWIHFLCLKATELCIPFILFKRVNFIVHKLYLKKQNKKPRVTEDKMVGWHHRFNGHKLGQTPGDGEGQGSLVCCSLWGRMSRT